MARKHRAIRIALFLLLGACTVPGARRDLSQAVQPADLEPLPEKVTAENARDVVRQCLQLHRRTDSSVYVRYGYAFRDRGFVQLIEERSEPERVIRVYVDYASVASTASQVFFDTSKLRERIEVTLRGAFRRWEARINPYRAQPDLDAEPATHPQESIVLLFDDASAARKLSEALKALSRK